MGFWIFMLLMDLLIPLTMIGFGKLFMTKSPQNINVVKGTVIIGTVGGIVCDVQLVPIIGSIFLTEAALKKTFDKNGIRR